MRNKPFQPSFLIATCLCILQVTTAFSQLSYPATKKVDQTDQYFGVAVKDPYRWLENDTATDTKAWISAQQAFTESYLSKIPFRPAINHRLKEISNYARFTGAFKVGDYIFFEKNDGLQNQYVFYYQQGIGGTEKVFIDPNQIAADGTASVSLDAPSTDKKYIGYHIHRNGSDWSTTYIMDIASHTLLPDSISWMRGDGPAWYKNGFFYVRYPEPAKGMELTAIATHPKLFYHTMGNPLSRDEFIYDDTSDVNIGFSAGITEDEHFLFLYRYKGTTGFEVLYKDLTKPGQALAVLFAGYDYQSSVVDNIGDQLLVLTNEDAGNFRLVKVDPAHPGKENWKTVIPEQKEKLDNVSGVGGKLFVSYLKNASSAIYRYSYDGKMEEQIQLPGFGTASGISGYKTDSFLFYNFTSFAYPPSIFKYDLVSGKSTVFKKTVSKIDLDQFTTDQVFYPSKDGTKIPMFLTHKKNLVMDGSHPTLLYAYGGFDVSITPSFLGSAYVLLENGGVYAVANIRGGGEFGEDWHKGGNLEKKQNVFDDFIAAEKWLVQNKYTSKEKLAVMGGSNGGLLIGAVMTQHPELIGVAFPEVGVLDMLRYQKFTSGVYWVSEYGSSDSASAFPYIYKYSPLHNVKAGIQYPPTMIVTADHDDRVVPMHSFKFAATLQEKQTGPHPILIRISSNQGHGASGSSLAKNIEMQTDIYSFLFYSMGIKPAY